MDSIKKTARFAGVLYALIGITAPVGLVYVPGKLLVSGDATATADRIRAAESLLRLGIASELVHQIVGVFLVLVLFRLFRAVNERHAALMVILSVLGVPIVMLNVLNEVAALTLVNGADFLSVFNKQQLDALAYLFLRLHNRGLDVAAFFWGLWLFPFAMLVMRSGFIPRALGYLMMIAGTAYLVHSSTALVLPQYSAVVGQFAMALYAGELPIMVWLLIWGAKEQSPRLAEAD